MFPAIFCKEVDRAIGVVWLGVGGAGVGVGVIGLVGLLESDTVGVLGNSIP